MQTTTFNWVPSDYDGTECYYIEGGEFGVEMIGAEWAVIRITEDGSTHERTRRPSLNEAKAEAERLESSR